MISNIEQIELDNLLSLKTKTKDIENRIKELQDKKYNVDPSLEKKLLKAIRDLAENFENGDNENELAKNTFNLVKSYFLQTINHLSHPKLKEMGEEIINNIPETFFEDDDFNLANTLEKLYPSDNVQKEAIENYFNNDKVSIHVLMASVKIYQLAIKNFDPNQHKVVRFIVDMVGHIIVNLETMDILYKNHRIEPTSILLRIFMANTNDASTNTVELLQYMKGSESTLYNLNRDNLKELVTILSRL